MIDRFFGGDIEAFDSGKSKSASFRALAKHPDLRFSATYLWTAVAVVGQLREFPENLGRRLPLSHHRLLLPIDDVAKKVALARRAVEAGLSKSELAIEIRQLCGYRAKRQPKPRADPTVLEALTDLVDASERFVLTATSVDGDLDRAGAESGRSLLRRLELDIDAVRCVVAMLRSRHGDETGGPRGVPPGKRSLIAQLLRRVH